jgi:glycosyltransferase involved in cell wall biosynthesis
MNPIVTVYITCYNYGAYVDKAIQSVLSQTLQDFELIIIDDGSTDESREVIKNYENHEKISVIFQQNKGLNATNNVAIKNAKGKYIIRLDADDYFESEALGVMSSILESDADLGLVFPDYHYVDIEGNRTGSHRRHFFDDEVTLYDQPAHGACTMVRLEYLRELDGYDESFSCQDGFELWIKFITFHKVTNISRPLFSYRKHFTSLSSNQDKILETRRKIKRKFAHQYLKSPDTLAIIPVRNRIFNGESWPLYKYNGKTVLDHRIATCFEAKNINHTIVTSSDEDVLNHLEVNYRNDSRLTILKRPERLESFDKKLNLTIDYALENHSKKHEAIALVSVEYPFVKSNIIDEALDTLKIFDSESVLSVKSSKGPYYRHTGKTLKAILDQDKYTSYEREALYQSVGGIMVSTMKAFQNSNSLIGERVSHLLVNDEYSFGVMNDFQFKLFKLMIKDKDATKTTSLQMKNETIES